MATTPTQHHIVLLTLDGARILPDWGELECVSVLELDQSRLPERTVQQQSDNGASSWTCRYAMLCDAARAHRRNLRYESGLALPRSPAFGLYSTLEHVPDSRHRFVKVELLIAPLLF